MGIIVHSLGGAAPVVAGFLIKKPEAGGFDGVLGYIFVKALIQP